MKKLIGSNSPELIIKAVKNNISKGYKIVNQVIYDKNRINYLIDNNNDTKETFEILTNLEKIYLSFSNK